LEFDLHLREQLFEAGVKLVDEPGPGVGRLRWALTDLDKTKTGMRLLPQSRLLGLGHGGATVEAEMHDSMTGTIVARGVDMHDPGYLGGGVRKWSDVKGSLHYWANHLAARLATGER
jgi:hypothetical protein